MSRPMHLSVKAKNSRRASIQFSAQPLSDLKQALERAKEDSPKDYAAPETSEALEFDAKS